MTLVASGTRFVGRGTEVRDVVDLVHHQRLVTLVGLGGAGKTRLALHALDELEPTFADGAFVAPLSELTDPSLLGHLVAARLGLFVAGPELTTTILTDHLDGQHVLLVLDNCEHLVDAVAELAVAILDTCPAVTILATSRSPLGLAREVVYDVPPLALPSAASRDEGDDGMGLSPDSIAEVASVELFVARAQAASATFRLSPANAGAVASIVTALDGLPLALELAGARVREMAPEVLATRLGDPLGVLDAGYRDHPPRHRSLTANLDWSFQLCSPAEQALWCRLAVFAGGFDVAAAEAVCAGEGVGADEILSLVSALASQSIIAQDATTPGRYRMPEPVRQFGIRHLTAGHQLTHWQDAHLAWVSSLGHDLATHWIGSDELAGMRRIRLEQANIRAAFEHAVATPRHATAALQLCHDLEPYWLCDGLLNEARLWVDRALAVAPGSGDAEIHASVMAATMAAGERFDMAYAYRLLDHATDILDTAQTASPRAHHAFAIALLAFYDQDLPAALTHGEAAIAALAAAHGRESYRYFHAVFWQALALSAVGRTEEAGVLIDEAISFCDRHPGEVYVRTNFHWVLGLHLLGQGEVDAALQNVRTALAGAWELRNNLMVALTLEALAWVNAAAGRARDAAVLFGGAARELDRAHVALMFPAFRDAGKAAGTSALGTAGFERAFAAGAATPLETLVTLAITGQDPRTAENPYAPLTRREAEIAALVADGLSSRAIAERLTLSERTVQGHIQNTLDKLHASSRAGIAAWYVRRSPQQ